MKTKPPAAKPPSRARSTLGWWYTATGKARQQKMFGTIVGIGAALLFPLVNGLLGLGWEAKAIPITLFIVLALAIPLMLGLAWVIRSTRMGKAMRAVAQDSEMAQQMGIDVNRVIAFTFLLGGVLAGAASLMYGLYNNNTVFTLGFTAGLKAFTAAVLGGIGNVNGAALGGFVLGLLSALTVTYAGGQWENVGVFSLLVIILVFKPTGLLGQETGEKA